MVRIMKLSDNNNLLDLYKKNKDLFFQKVELTFDLIKNKILLSNEEEKKKIIIKIFYRKYLKY